VTCQYHHSMGSTKVLACVFEKGNARIGLMNLLRHDMSLLGSAMQSSALRAFHWVE
jgi:hypothetical protein